MNCLFVVRVFFCLYATFQEVTAQTGYELLIGTDGRASLNDSNEDIYGNVIHIANQMTPTQPQYDKSYVIKVSSLGDTLIKIFDFTDTLCYLQQIEINTNNEYLIFGGIGVEDTAISMKKMDQLWVLKLDSSLNILADKRYKLAWDYWNPYYFTSISLNGLIYAGGYCQFFFNGIYRHFFMAVFNMDGDTISSSYPDLGNLTVGSHTFENKLEIINGAPGITLFGDGFINNSQGQIIEIDSSLNYTVTEVGCPANYAYWWSSLKHLDESHYFFATAANPYNIDLDDDVMLMKMDMNHQCQDYIILNRPDTNDYPAWRRGIDFVYKDRIFVSGHQQHFLNEPVNSNIFVYLIDSALNIKGMKYYGGEKNYSIYTITATMDGGCVLGGSVFDWQNSPPDVVDLWIRKIMPDELITHAEDTPSPDDYDISISPNPFTDFIYIGTIRDGLELSVLNVDGKEVLREKIKGELNQQVNTTTLLKGIYFYKIYSKKKVIQKGRILKF